MNIGLVRDWVIVITGVIEIIILILLGVVAWSIKNKVQEVTVSVKKVTASAQTVVDSAKGVVDSLKVSANNVATVSGWARNEIAEPLVKTAATVQGISAGIDSILGIFQTRRR